MSFRASTKYGFTSDEMHEILAAEEWQALKNIEFFSEMGMATFDIENY